MGLILSTTKIKIIPGMVAHTYNLSYLGEAEIWRIEIGGQPVQKQSQSIICGGTHL
jgi:hypothetical protein